MNKGLMSVLVCLLAGLSCSRTTPVGEVRAAPQNNETTADESPRRQQSSVASPPEPCVLIGGDRSSPSSVSFASGNLSLRTSSFQPVAFDETSTGWRQRASDRDHPPSMVIATVEIRNDSLETVTLDKLAVIQPGCLTVYEDQLIFLSMCLYGDVGLLPDRGSVSCYLDAPLRTRLSPGRNLLGEETCVITPHTTSSFDIHIACFRQSHKHDIAPGNGYYDVRAESLDALDQFTPWVQSATHILLAVAQVTVQGSGYTLYSDQLYALSPALLVLRLKRPVEPGTDATSPARHHVLDDHYALPASEFIAHILQHSVRTYDETLAYRVATDTRVVPAGFDPLTVSPLCYSGDPNSPMNAAGSVTEQSSLLAQNRQLFTASLARLRDAQKRALADIKNKYKDSLTRAKKAVALKTQWYSHASDSVQRSKSIADDFSRLQERNNRKSAADKVRDAPLDSMARSGGVASGFMYRDAIKSLEKAAADLKAATAAYEAILKDKATDEAHLKETVATAITRVNASAAKHDVILRGGGELSAEKMQESFAAICDPVLQQWSTAAPTPKMPGQRQ